MTNSRATWWRGVVRDHSGLLVLLAMCGVLSLTTIEVQHPTDADAGRTVVRQLLQERPEPVVFIAADETEKHDEFVAAVEEAVVAAGGRVLRSVRGDPRAVRLAIEEMVEEGGVPDALISLREANAWEKVLQGAPERHPELADTAVIAPAPYRWSTFLTRRNLLNVTEKIVVWAVIGIGMTLVIITAGIDLSVGSLVALSSVVTALVVRRLGGEEASVGGVAAGSLCGLAACAASGVLIGLFVTRFRVAPFIVSLGMMMAASGLALRLTNGESIDEVPDSFAWLGHGSVLGLPNSVLLMFVLYACAHVLMHHTMLGRAIYAVGGNPEAARLSGVPVRRVLVFVYGLCGLLAGVGGLITASTFESGDPNYGQTYELYVIAAVVVGGTSLSGGQGRVLGTLIGALMLGVIYNGMNLQNVGGFSQKIVLGAVILLAVVLDQWKRRGGAG